MLKQLKIRNFAVVESVSLEFGPGFSVFTGETGAGKSIIIEALSFLLGARGTVDWIRAGEDRVEVEGTFGLEHVPVPLRQEFGLSGPDVSLRRELDRAGKGRAFVNGSPRSVSTLARLGDCLVDFHGQHEHQSLLKTSVQLDLLDSYGRLETLRSDLTASYGRWSEIRARLEMSRMSEEERLRALDLYRFQASEIDAAAPKAGEDAELEAALPRLKNVERLRALAAEAAGHLVDAENAAVATLAKAGRVLEELSRQDTQMSGARDLVSQGRIAVEEAARVVSSYGGALEADPERLEAMLERLETLSRLKRKYGPTLEDILEARRRIGVEIARLEDFHEQRGDLIRALSEAEARLDRLCQDCHTGRMAAAGRLAAGVVRSLKGLGMPGVRFSISVEMEEGRRGPTGADAVEFLIAPNPGEPLKPLRAVASGGELSRTMLGLKTVLAAQDRIPILVFDEVDAGVGGVVAHAVGRNLAALACARQVLCVTHLPQVASYAARHFSVSKGLVRGRTVAEVRTLSEESRREEIARMLSGRDATRTSLQAAEELLAAAGKAPRSRNPMDTPKKRRKGRTPASLI